MQSMKRRSSL